MTDLLGSITNIGEESNGTMQNYSFYACGMLRDASNWSEEFEDDLFADRWFNGHEHLQDFDLINMYGRINDPANGRLLSPDPYVQATGYPNSYNRYSYVLNNPLRFVDPSGYRPVGIFEEEELMNQNGGGINNSWNPFGWINNAPTGWTDFTGPNLGQWHYWHDNVSGNPLYGESADEFTAWYREMRYGDQKTEDWGNAIDYGLNYSSYDVTTVNRAGVSKYNIFPKWSTADYLLFGVKVYLGNFDFHNWNQLGLLGN